jgi:GTP-binding protein HflX
VKTISLVGYTNAGKSTLFNRLCEADVHAADQLFATLDPTFRQLELPVIGNAILADTVGFIRQLPHDLIDAFRATLEEVSQADLLLHVVDVSYADHLQRIDEVQEVLDSIGAGAVPQLVVYNKIDASDECSRIDFNAEGSPERVWVSAADGSGIDLLLQALTARLAEGVVETRIRVAPDEGRLRAALFSEGCVLDETAQMDGSIDMLVRIEQYRLERIGISYEPGNLSN